MKSKPLVIKTHDENLRDHALTWLWGFCLGVVASAAIYIVITVCSRLT